MAGHSATSYPWRVTLPKINTTGCSLTIITVRVRRYGFLLVVFWVSSMSCLNDLKLYIPTEYVLFQEKCISIAQKPTGQAWPTSRGISVHLQWFLLDSARSRRFVVLFYSGDSPWIGRSLVPRYRSRVLLDQRVFSLTCSNIPVLHCVVDWVLLVQTTVDLPAAQTK